MHNPRLPSKDGINLDWPAGPLVMSAGWLPCPWPFCLPIVLAHQRSPIFFLMRPSASKVGVEIRARGSEISLVAAARPLADAVDSFHVGMKNWPPKWSRDLAGAFEHENSMAGAKSVFLAFLLTLDGPFHNVSCLLGFTLRIASIASTGRAPLS